MEKWEYLDGEFGTMYFKLSKKVGFDWLKTREPAGKEMIADDPLVEEISPELNRITKSLWTKPTFQILPDKLYWEWEQLVNEFMDYLGGIGWEMVSKQTNGETGFFRRIVANFKRKIT